VLDALDARRDQNRDPLGGTVSSTETRKRQKLETAERQIAWFRLAATG
jgi:hypothetical protein